MSAPTTHDPRFVNTRDGVCWERRAVTDSGLGLYAVEGSCKCPPFKMATFVELAAHGIVEWADVLPMPVGPQPSERDRPRAAFIEALDNAAKTHPCPVLGDQFWSGCVHYDEAGHVAGVGSCHSERRADAVLVVRDAEMERLRSQIAELNESVSTAEALRANAQQALPWAHEMPDADLSMFLDDLVSAAMNRWRTDPDGPVPDRVTLADIERVCREWRTPGEGYRSDPEPEASPTPRQADGFFDGVPVSPPSERPVAALREVLDGEHFATVHHDYKGPGRDMPKLGGAR